MNDVGQWLDSLGLARYAELFAAHEIDGEVLPDLTDEDLRELGISLGHRKKLLKALASLPVEAAETIAGRPSVPSEAERRQLTVMFCDLVGSTELAERLDPEQLREIIGAYQEACAKTVKAFEGFIARYMGDGLLVYFGYPQAHEDDAERAVRAGLGIVDAIGRLAPTDDVELRVRIGIATGLVVVGDIVGEGASEERAVLGETPNLAARLQGLAEPDTVVISQATRRLVEGLFDCRDLGAQPLKGISEPVSAYRVAGESAAPSRFEAAAIQGMTQLVGREEEIGLLLKRWRQAMDGEGQVLVLTGEAGVGKSRILRALREHVETGIHNRVLYYCSPYHQNSALYPAINQLERAARFEKSDGPGQKLDRLETVLDGLGLPVAEIAPVLATMLSLPVTDRYPPLDMSPQQLRNRTLDALVTVIEAMAAQNPVLMVLEDAHWIDPTSLDMLSMAIERLRSLRIFLIVTARPEFVPPWEGQAHLTALALNRLGRRECAEMIDGVTAGKALPGEVLDHIVAKTDGVPLFVEELTKTVVESGLLEEADDRYLLNGPLPPLAIPASLQDSLMARLDRLAPVKDLAQLAAVIGRAFSHDLLAAVSPLGEDGLGDALAQLVEAGLVYRRGLPPDATYEFKHALVQDAAYESMLKSKRSQLHKDIAETLETLFPAIVETQPEVLARHYSMAKMAEPAIAYWRRAGDMSADASANIEAVSHFENALELLESLSESDDRDQLELELRVALGGPLLMTRGHGAPEVGSTYTRARELCRKIGDSPQIVPALFGMWRFYIGRGDCTITRDLGRQLLDLGKSAGDMPAVVLGHYGLGFALFCYGDLKDARVQLEDGYKLYDRTMRDDLSFRLGQDPGIACLSYWALALWVLGYPDQAKRTTRKALALAEELSHPFSSAYALSLACQVLQHRGEVDEVQKASETAIGISREQGFSVWIASPTIFRGWMHSQQGNAIEGAQEAHEGVHAIIDAGMEMRRPYYLALVAECYVLAGQFAEARSVLDEALVIVAKTDEHWSEAELLRLLGEIEAREDSAQAETRFRQALTVAQHQDAKSWELRCATSLARLWQAQGKSDDAGVLLRPIYDWFTEGFDTPDLKEAKGLLDALA